MRRVIVGVAAIAAMLAFTLAFAPAQTLPQPPGRDEIGSQLMLRLFGETSDSIAAFAAERGDRTSESPLRDLALQLTPAIAKTNIHSDFAAPFAQERLAWGNLVTSQLSAVTLAPSFTAAAGVVHFAVPAASNDDNAIVVPSQHFTVAYQPVPPQPAISPAPGTLEFASPQARAFVGIPSAAQLGAVRFDAHASDQQPALPQLTLNDANYGAAANFDVRAGKRNVSVNLSGEYQQASLNSFSGSAAAPASSWQLPDGNLPLFAPSNSDLNRLSLAAGVSVPVLRGLTLNLNYGAARLYDAYGPTGLVNLDTVSNTYGGKLTFNIPRISSSLSIGAYQDRFPNSILPISGQTQTREDVNFTVKF